VSEQRISFRKATEIVGDRLKIGTREAQIRLIEADAKGKIHVVIDQNEFAEALTNIKVLQEQRIIEPTLGKQQADDAISGFEKAGSALAMLAESAKQGAIAQSALIECGMISQDELLSWLDSISEPKLKKASPAAIRDVITAPKQNKRRTRNKRDRAMQAIKAIWPNGLPNQTELPNDILCKRVSEWLKADCRKQNISFVEISDDTILRAAGRQK
jgi:hypothetical protein